MWKLRVPPKVKNLVWRVYRDYFPTHVSVCLNSRGVSCPSKCVLCSDAHEDSLHALFTCPRASHVWQAANEFDNRDTVVFCLMDRLQLS